MLEETKLAGYCGMYCAACAMNRGEIRTAISRLRELVDIYDLTRIAQFFGGIEEFPRFLKVLEDLDRVLGVCAGCRAGGGWPNCPFRRCCLDKGLRSCHECREMPCQELVKFQKRHFLHPAPHYGKVPEV